MKRIATVFLCLAALAALGFTANQVTVIRMAPVVANSDVYAGSLGGTATKPLAACTSATAAYTGRTTIQSTASGNGSLCYYNVATGAACSSVVKDCDGAGTDDGNLLLSERAVRIDLRCDRDLCLIAAATNTTVHVSRDIYPQ